MEQTITAPPAHDPAGNPSPVVRRRGRPRDTSADERILQAAGRLILERGFDKVTVDDVATLARAGKATVYRRWASKEDLAVAALELLYRQEMVLPDTGSVRNDLLEYYRNVLEFAGSPTGYSYIRMSMAEALRDSRIAALHESATRTQERLFEQLLQRGIERGEIRPDAPLGLLMAAFGGIITQCAVLGREMPKPADVEVLLDLFFGGIQA